MNKDKKQKDATPTLLHRPDGETFEVISYDGGLGDQNMLLWNKFAVNSTYKVKGYGVKANHSGITRIITEIVD